MENCMEKYLMPGDADILYVHVYVMQQGLTPTKLMEKVSDNMSGVTSFANSVRLDIELEDVLYTTAVSMDIDMESTMEPKAGHAKGTAHLKMRGAELESVLEIYQAHRIREARHIQQPGRKLEQGSIRKYERLRHYSGQQPVFRDGGICGGFSDRGGNR